MLAETRSPLATLLGKLEACKDKDGYTLIEHVKEMFNRILLKPSDYPLDKFEDLSYLIKLTHLKITPPLEDKEVNKMTFKMSEMQEWIQKYLAQFRFVTTFK